MSIDESQRDAWAAMQASRGRTDTPESPLKGGGGGGTFDGMEARVAKLEAGMENVRAELAKLASVPVDVATIKERSSHLPTKADVKSEITVAIDRAAAATQRRIAITGGLVTLAIALITYAPKIAQLF